MKKITAILIVLLLVLTACPLSKPKVVELRVTPQNLRLYSGEETNITFNILYDDGVAEEVSYDMISISDIDNIVLSESGLKVGNELEADKSYQVSFLYEDISTTINLEVVSNPLLNYTLDDNGNKIVDDHERLDVIVSKEYHLIKEAVPSELVIPDIRWPDASLGLGYNPDRAEKMNLRPVAAKALEDLFAAAEREGHMLYGVSGYRSYSNQANVFAYNVQRFGSETEANRISARPGESEHHTALVMDISSESLDQYKLQTVFATTPEGQWVAENAVNYGFIIRYPKEKEEITGYSFEPWHLRYVGEDLARKLYDSGLTMEEYFERFLEE
jgi:D-alanyl-D-alanine carboxypeptidase